VPPGTLPQHTLQSGPGFFIQQTALVSLAQHWWVAVGQQPALLQQIPVPLLQSTEGETCSNGTHVPLVVSQT
jgi:hypothetical protein